jgi:3-dehydroquinate dehydratase-2
MIINGPNLNMLGIREPAHYGRETYADLIAKIEDHAAALGIEVKCLQSNHEGDLVDYIQSAHGEYDGIVINPGAYTHTSIAILDALKAVAIPACEVHLTDVNQREEFRKVSYVRLACEKTFAGFGFEGYKMAMEHLVNRCR